MCCAVCHLVYFACKQCSSARKGWQHSTNVQEEAGSEPPTKKQRLRKWEMVELRQCLLSIEPLLSKRTSEQLGVPASEYIYIHEYIPGDISHKIKVTTGSLYSIEQRKYQITPSKPLRHY